MLEAPQFCPLQMVTVIHLGLRMQGRVQACILRRGGWSFEVEFSDDGDLKTREFYGDELEDRK